MKIFEKTKLSLNDLEKDIHKLIKQKNTEIAFIETSKYEIEISNLLHFNEWNATNLHKNCIYRLAKYRQEISKIEFNYELNIKNAANYSFFSLSYFFEKHLFCIAKAPPSFTTFINEKKYFDEKKILRFDNDFWVALNLLNINLDSFQENTYNYLFKELPIKIGLQNIEKLNELFFFENWKENSKKRNELVNFIEELNLEILRLDILNNVNSILENNIDKLPLDKKD